jgi:hypothetical protein
MKKYLISFADERYKNKQLNLNNSAINYFDKIISYSPENYDNNFYEKNKHILNQNRGCGYWLWKSYFISKTFEIMNKGDILVYIDSGNTIVGDINLLFNKLINDKNGLILFDNRDTNYNNEIWQNYQWTKFDCFNLMNCIGDEYFYGNQLDASYQFYIKNEFCQYFNNEYLKYSQNENIITDIPNITGNNLNGFIDHRHDQSILSLLSIKHKISIFREPSEYGNNYIGNENYNNYPQIFNHHR